ncbi:MAG: site-2 protease family protein [Candidatus Saccharibacteria bacterium]|nr:site-2 protease family protein [Candidatus Saccharibacteria bacterium]
MIDIPYIITLIAVILVSMTLHEAMHAFMGYWLGDTTAKEEGRLTLNPIHHIDPFLTIILPVTLAVIGAPIFGGAKPVPFNPARVRYGEWGAALVALAGPITNLLIAFVVFGVVAIFSIDTATPLGMVCQMAVLVNLGFFVFNMLPMPPLDGSRVVYALAPEFVRRGMEVIEQYGIMLVFVLVMVASSVGLLGNIMQLGIEAVLQLFTWIFSAFL